MQNFQVIVQHCKNFLSPMGTKASKSINIAQTHIWSTGKAFAI